MGNLGPPLSSPAKAGDPVNADVSIVTSVTEYWMPRWSLSSGGHSADPLAGHDEKLSLHHQCHAPNRLAIDQEPHRLRVVFQRQPVRDIGADLAGFRPFRQRLQAHFAERRISSHGLAGADAEHAGALDQQKIGTGQSNTPGETDDEDACAPGDAAHAVLEHFAANGIEYYIGAAAIGDALNGIAKRLA